MKKFFKKSIILSVLLLTGCGFTGGPVKNDINVDQSLKRLKEINKKAEESLTLNTYFFDVKKGETLGKIMSKIIKKIPDINLYIDKDVNLNAKLENAYLKHVNIYQYLNFLNLRYEGPKKFVLKNIDGIYTLKLEENKEYKNKIINEIKNKIEKRNIKLFKTYTVSIKKGTKYSEFFNDLYNIYKIKVNLKLANISEFLNKTFNYDYTGSLYDLIQNICNENLVDARYYDGITFIDYVTKTYQIKIPPFYINDETFRSTKIDLYKLLEEQIKQIIKIENQKYELAKKQLSINNFNNNNIPFYKEEKNKNSKNKKSTTKTTSKTVKTNKNKELIYEPDSAVFINKATNTITVTARPEVQKKIEKYIKLFNKIYSKAIRFKITFFKVELRQDQGFGIDIPGMIKYLVDKSLAIAGKKDYIAEINQNTTSNITDTFATGITIKNQAEATKAIMKFLNKFGITRIVQSPSFMTINNVPYFIHKTRTKEYVSKVEVKIEQGKTIANQNQVVQNPDQVSINPTVSELQEGFNLAVKGTIDPQTNDIYVTINPNIIQLNSLIPYKYIAGYANNQPVENTIYLKDMSIFNLDTNNGQTVKIKPGQTAIIGGFILDNDNVIKDAYPGQSYKDEKLDWLNTKTKNATKSELIIMITAYPVY